MGGTLFPLELVQFWSKNSYGDLWNFDHHYFKAKKMNLTIFLYSHIFNAKKSFRLSSINKHKNLIKNSKLSDMCIFIAF